jgi:hypothetical protein
MKYRSNFSQCGKGVKVLVEETRLLQEVDDGEEDEQGKIEVALFLEEDKQQQVEENHDEEYPEEDPVPELAFMVLGKVCPG